MNTYVINWTDEAEESFNQNIEYLAREWNHTILNRFLDRVDSVIQSISSNPFLFPLHPTSENVRKCVVNERILLLYRVVDDTQIDIISFWNTHRSPRNIKF